MVLFNKNDLKQSLVKKKRESKKEKFKKQILLLRKRKNSPKRIRQILNLSYNKQSLPSLQVADFLNFF